MKSYVDIGPKVFTCGMLYIALSQVQNISGLAIKAFDPTKLKASDVVLSRLTSAQLPQNATTNISPFANFKPLQN